MSLRIEVNGFGICKTSSPYCVFVICCQQENFEAWAVYRRFQSFILLRDRLISHNHNIPPFPQIDYNNYDLRYLESVRVFLDNWLQSLTCNTSILRMQAMYQFLCIDANMQPSPLELYWADSLSQKYGNKEMEMNEMFDVDDDNYLNEALANYSPNKNVSEEQFFDQHSDFPNEFLSNYSPVSKEPLSDQLPDFPNAVLAKYSPDRKVSKEPLTDQLLDLPNEVLARNTPNQEESSLPIVQNVRWNRCKIMIVGQGRAGKTALANNLTGVWIPDTPSTIGAEQFDVKLYYGGAHAGKLKKFNSPELETEALLAEGLLESANLLNVRNLINSARSNDVLSEEHFPRKFKLRSDEINHGKVIHYKELLGMEISSKYKLTLIDFGGQSIFNVLHAFFMSKYSIYLLVFDMELFLSNDEEKRQSCHREMKFWIDTIALHAFDSATTGKIAPVAIVGTKGDIIVMKEQYREISEEIKERYEQNSIWEALIWFEGGEEFEGERFCFFPNNNTLTESNAVRARLLQNIENTLDQSDHMKKFIPVVWVKLLDEMKSLKLSCVSYDKVIAITRERFLNQEEKELEIDIIMIFVDNMLHFLNNLGMILWKEEKSLRDIIILDPIDYFVKPATIIICKHFSSKDEPDDVKTFHEISEIHGKSRKEHEKAWKIMLESGMVSELLARDLLKRFYQAQKIFEPEVVATRVEKVLLLMEQYGLAVSLMNSSIRFIPALLPDAPTQIDEKQKRLVKRLKGIYQSLHDPFSIGTHYSLFCHLPVKKEARIFPALSDAELSQQGFLPHGLFERFVCRCLQAMILREDNLIAKTDGIVSLDGHLVESRLICGFRGKVEFSYNCHRIRMINRIEENRIEIIIELHEKVSRDKEEALFLEIYNKTAEVMGSLLRESYSRLEFSTLIHPSELCSTKGNGLITLRKVRSLLKDCNEFSELVRHTFSSEDQTCAFVLAAQDMKRSLYWSVWREEDKIFSLLKGGVPTSPVHLLLANGKSTHVFLSHDWGVNGENHQKIKLVGEALVSKGLKVWIDDGLDDFGKRRIATELPQTIYAAIENTSCMLIFITQNYLNKVNGEDITDYCQREFLFGFRQLGRRMIPIIVDSNVSKLFKEKKTLGGLIGGHLEGFLYYDMSSVFDPSSSTLNEEMKRSIEELFARIINLIDIPSCSKLIY